MDPRLVGATCLYGQACGTCLRRIMLPMQSGELTKAGERVS